MGLKFALGPFEPKQDNMPSAVAGAANRRDWGFKIPRAQDSFKAQ